MSLYEDVCAVIDAMPCQEPAYQLRDLILSPDGARALRAMTALPLSQAIDGRTVKDIVAGGSLSEEDIAALAIAGILDARVWVTQPATNLYP